MHHWETETEWGKEARKKEKMPCLLTFFKFEMLFAHKVWLCLYLRE